MSQFGRKIAASVSRDPVFEAMFTDTQVIPNTWGNIASQLFEEGIVETNADAAADLLGIDRADLSDPTLRFTTAREANQFELEYKQRKETEYKASRRDGIEKFHTYMTNIVENHSTESDPEQLKALSDRYGELQNRPTSNQSEYEEVTTQKGVTKLQFLAVKSGLQIPITEFTALVLSYEDESGFTLGERISALDELISYNVIHDHLLLDPSLVSPNEIPIGQELYRSFVANLRGTLQTDAYSYGMQQWERIEHIFYAPYYKEHPLFAGSEKQD